MAKSKQSSARLVFMPPNDSRFKETFFLVEASSYEQRLLNGIWLDLLRWEQDMRGSMGEIGRLDGRPVTLSVFWARIEGRLVGFWESPSEVTDHAMIKKWFAKNCVPPKWRNGTREARCGAEDFTDCVAAIQEAEANEQKRPATA